MNDLLEILNATNTLKPESNMIITKGKTNLLPTIICAKELVGYDHFNHDCNEEINSLLNKNFIEPVSNHSCTMFKNFEYKTNAPINKPLKAINNKRYFKGKKND